MNIITKIKNLEITEASEEFIQKRIAGLERFIDVLRVDDPIKGKTLAEVFVEVEKETKHHRKGNIFLVKVQVVLPGKSLVAEAKADSLLKAVTEVKKEMVAEIKKYKFKNIDKNRRAGRAGKK